MSLDTELLRENLKQALVLENLLDEALRLLEQWKDSARRDRPLHAVTERFIAHAKATRPT